MISINLSFCLHNTYYVGPYRILLGRGLNYHPVLETYGTRPRYLCVVSNTVIISEKGVLQTGPF
jgi:hypothetical protein